MFLDSIEPSDEPRLIAAGPGLPSRLQWPAFVDRVEPAFVYLALTPEEELVALRERRTKHKGVPEIADHPLFGSWDEELTTIEQDGRWIDVDDITALENIRREMVPSTDIYERHASAEHSYSKAERWGSQAYRVVTDIGRLLQVR